MQSVRITQLDGALPNIAIMKLAHWHRSRGDRVTVSRTIERDLFEPDYDRVYGSSIFKFSNERIDRFKTVWPGSIIGGTGTFEPRTVENIIGVESYEHYDYTGFDCDYSIGFTQRGCRLKCKFCVVPMKEGKNRSVNTIADIWRGSPHPKKLHLLDNDFFGQPEDQWQARVEEIVNGGFRICLSQGINVRLLNEKAAAALARMEYRSADFQRRRLYTAWDNLGDEKVFFNGMDLLEAAGIPADRVMAYMLIGFDKRETWEAIWHRFNRMVERGIKPFPMVFDRTRKDLTAFQRWVNLGLYRIIPWADYTGKPHENLSDLPGSRRSR
jgi:hypothetical protein